VSALFRSLFTNWKLSSPTGALLACTTAPSCAHHPIAIAARTSTQLPNQLDVFIRLLCEEVRMIDVTYADALLANHAVLFAYPISCRCACLINPSSTPATRATPSTTRARSISPPSASRRPCRYSGAAAHHCPFVTITSSDLIAPSISLGSASSGTRTHTCHAACAPGAHSLPSAARAALFLSRPSARFALINSSSTPSSHIFSAARFCGTSVPVAVQR